MAPTLSLRRREFLKSTTLSLGASTLVLSNVAPSMPRAPRASSSTGLEHTAEPNPTIRQVIDAIIGRCSGKPLPQTVDVVKTGDPSQKVKGVVTTFMATRSVIEKAVQLGANLIITHEPVFYNHTDDISWLKDYPAYVSKRRLIDDNGIVIWRFHDYWHMHRPDGIVTGLLRELGWEKYADADRINVCTIPSMPLDRLAEYLKEKLKTKSAEIVGKSDMPCRRVAILVGASAGRSQIDLLARPDIDVVIAGDINEWEGCEYTRDAVSAGINKGFIVLGHANTEEPGMKYLVEWLRPILPGIPITHVPAMDPFRLI